MKSAALLLFLIVCFLPVFAFGQNLTITKPYTYAASNDDSRNSARAKAMQEAQAALLQELGVLVEARQKMTNRTSNNNSQQDFTEELKTYSVGKVKTSVVEGTEKFADNIFSATFNMVVDTADLYRYLDGILKQKQQARADSIKNVREIENQRFAKEKKITELELTVEAARNLLDREQKQEEPLRKIKELKNQELQEAQKQRNSAQKAFENAKKSDDAHLNTGIERIKREGESLQIAEKNYNGKHAEYKIAVDNWNGAVHNVEAAKNSLQTAQNNLNKELGIKITPEKELKKSSEVKTTPQYTDYITRKTQTFDIPFNQGAVNKRITFSWEVSDSEAVVLGIVNNDMVFIGYYYVGDCGRSTCFYFNMRKSCRDLYIKYYNVLPYQIHIDPMFDDILLHYNTWSVSGKKVKNPEGIEQVLPKESYFQLIKEIESEFAPPPDKNKEATDKRVKRVSKIVLLSLGVGFGISWFLRFTSP